MPQRRLAFERVESRFLLAVDLAIQVDDYELGDESAGQQVQRVIRVFNNGDEDAIDAVVHSDLTGQLDNPQWTRHAAYAQRVPTTVQLDDVSLVSNSAPEYSFGDINGDGFADYYRNTSHDTEPRNCTTIYLGSTELNRVSSPSPSDIERLSTGAFSLPFPTIGAVDVGDVNDDGLADFAFDTNLILGSRTIDASNVPDWIEIDTGFTTKGYDDFYNARFGGDFNGDGINDLMFVMDGPSCAGRCTATERDILSVDAGVAIILGHPDIGSTGKLEAVSVGLRFPFIVPYFERLDAVAKDVNLDGRNDVIITARNRKVVILGRSNMASIDLRDIEHARFDGENGFVTSIDSRVAGEFELNRFSKDGRGNILDKLTVQAGRGATYTVTGTLKPNADPSIKSLVTPSRDQVDEVTSDNAFPRESGIQVELTASYSTPVEGESFEMDVVIENTGEFPANSLSVHETVTQHLLDAEWTLTSSELFPIRIDGHLPSLGPSTDGFTLRPNFQGRSTSSLDETDLYFSEHETIGLAAGSLGDVNDDGFDDFFVNRSLGNLFPFQVAIEVFYGGPEFGKDGTFDTVGSSRVRTTRDFAVDNENQMATISLHPQDAATIPGLETETILRREPADFDGDGVADGLTYTDQGLKITFGETEQSDDQRTVDFPLAGEFESFTDLGEVSAWNRIAIGDINGDGVDDLAVSSDIVRVYFGGADFGKDIAFTATPAFSAPLSVASGFDANADGIEDLLVSDPSAGWASRPLSYDAFVVFGRKRTDLSGNAGVESTFNLQPKERVTLKISGTLLSSAAIEGGTVSVVTPSDQANITPHKSVVTIASPTAASDLNADGIVGFADFLILSANFGKSDVTRSDGDIDGDGAVSFADFLILNAEFATRTDV